jgi:ABC-type multidrug transport system permease subunit
LAHGGGNVEERRARLRPCEAKARAAVAFIVGVIYLVLLITLGVISLRKGHWVMFIIGIFIPLFWIIGAIMPSRERLR